MSLSEFINRQRIIDTFTALIKINSPSFQEMELGEFLKKRLESIGCDVEFQKYDRSFNLLAFKRGTRPEAPPILLSGHMDTIEPTEGISYSLENGVIRSTGSTVLGADDKSALAQILEALTVIHERNLPHGDLEIAFTSAEEDGLHGAKNLDLSKLKSRYALVLDSSGEVGKLVVAAPTHYKYEMWVTGRPAHAGIEPEKGISAIRAASKIISAVPDGRINDVTTANIGIISGGTATNVVPREVIVNGEIRSHNLTDLEQTRMTIFDLARSIAGREKVKIEISGQEEYRSFRIDDSNPFLKFLDDVYRTCGMEPVHAVTGGGSDANIFNSRGITAINISSGMQKVHSTEEFIEIKDLYNGSLVVLHAVTALTNADLN